MGGMLLQPIWNLPPKRVSQADYKTLGNFILDKLNDFAPNRRYRVFRSFDGKESHGDIDIAVESLSGDKVDWLKFFEQLSGHKPHKNGKTISVPIEGFQCDFSFYGSENYEIAYIYNSYEIGNFMGIFANKIGLKFGHNGLWLKIPLNYFSPELPEHECKEIFITKDPEEIFGILGFDFEREQEGFDKPLDMYEWVANSVYFKKKLFDFESLNSINRTRNRKRPNYANFIEWCQDKEDSNFPINSKESVRQSIIEIYSHIYPKIEEAKAEIILNKERRAKFNGNIIKEFFGLEGKALGDFIIGFKKSYSINGSFDEFLDRHSADAVRLLMKFYYAAN